MLWPHGCCTLHSFSAHRIHVCMSVVTRSSHKDSVIDDFMKVSKDWQSKLSWSRWRSRWPSGRKYAYKQRFHIIEYRIRCYFTILSYNMLCFYRQGNDHINTIWWISTFQTIKIKIKEGSWHQMSKCVSANIRDLSVVL